MLKARVFVWMRVSVRVKTCGVHSADFITHTSGSNHGLDLSPCYVPHFKTFSFVINMDTLKSSHAARSGIQLGFCLKGISCALKVSYFTGAGRLILRIKLNQMWRDLSPLKLSYIMSNNGEKSCWHTAPADPRNGPVWHVKTFSPGKTFSSSLSNE